MKAWEKGDLPPKKTPDSFYYVLNRTPQLKALFIVWDSLPKGRRRDLLVMGRALVQEERRKQEKERWRAMAKERQRLREQQG